MTREFRIGTPSSLDRNRGFDILALQESWLRRMDLTLVYGQAIAPRDSLSKHNTDRENHSIHWKDHHTEKNPHLP